MPPRLPKLIFDTSGINFLADDSDRNAISAGISIAHQVGITGTSLSEIVADPDETGRHRRLDLLKRFVGGTGMCIMPFNWITDEHAKAYDMDPKGYDWRSVNVRFIAAEEEIARQEILHTISAETLADNKRLEKEFIDTFKNARPDLEKLFLESQKRPTLEESITLLVAKENGVYFKIAGDLYEKAVGQRPTNDALADFVERCPPFKAMIMGICFLQFDLSIRDLKHPRLARAGRNDVLMATYLPYCKKFVTNDKGQYDALNVITKLAGLDNTILMYPEFKKTFGIGLSA